MHGTEGKIMAQMRKLPLVFIVDDEPIIASTLESILRLKGYDALSFTDPVQAEQAAFAENPDLLISDVVMPRLSGLDLALSVQARCPGCKVLLFSGQASTCSLLELAGKDGHHFDLLTKPMHPVDLLKQIAKTMEFDA